MLLINKRNYIFILLLFFVTYISNLRSQPIDTTKSIIIKKISINGVTSELLGNKYVLSNKDSINFSYGLETKEKNPKSPFLFKITLINELDSSSINTGQTNFSYKDLNEGNYKLIISAFELQRRWSSKELQLNLEIDNEKSKYINELDSIKKAKKLSDLSSNNDNNSNSLFLGNNIIFLLILIIIFIFLIFFIFYKYKNKIQNKTAIEFKENIMEPKSNLTSHKDNNTLILENSELRAEIALLRGQIDALNLRGELLTKQNKELQTNLNKLEVRKGELEDLQKQKDDLFAVIIHDIKNPASLIKSLVELLTSYDLSATEQRDIIKDIAHTTSKIVNLSQEVTKILSLESSTIHLELEIVDMNEIVKDVNQRNQISARNKSISLFAEYDDTLPQAEVDAQKIDEALDNLVSNAIKFTPNGGIVRIKSYKELNNIVVEVSDNGLGLSEEDIKNSFKRGVKLSAIPTAGESSTGMGLWIVKKLIESHKGRVWVKSSLGKGSTFGFTIPMRQDKNN